MKRTDQLLAVASTTSLLSALAGVVVALTATDFLPQAAGGLTAILSLVALACTALARKNDTPASAPAVDPTQAKASLGRFLDGLEAMIAGDTSLAVPMPEHIKPSERERLESATVSLRALLQKHRTQSQPNTANGPAVPQPQPAPAVAEKPSSTSANSNPNKHLAALSQRLEQLAAQLLAATGSNEENRESTQEQLAALKLQARKLSDRSRMLGDNVDLLKDLAEQSGVLALNAAIQASRSGEDGLGIIADELQRVANRHTDAGRQFDENLQQLNADLIDTNKIIDTGRQHLSHGQHDVSQLRRHISELARTCNALRNQSGRIGNGEAA